MPSATSKPQQNHRPKSAIASSSGSRVNKNGRKDVYEDSSQPVDKRVEDLLSQMTVEEKNCHLATLYGYGRVLKDPLPTPEWKNKIWKDGVANIDEMHNGVGISGDASNPYIATPAATAEALNEVQRIIEETRLAACRAWKKILARSTGVNH